MCAIFVDFSHLSLVQLYYRLSRYVMLNWIDTFNVSILTFGIRKVLNTERNFSKKAPNLQIEWERVSKFMSFESLKFCRFFEKVMWRDGQSVFSICMCAIRFLRSLNSILNVFLRFDP